MIKKFIPPFLIALFHYGEALFFALWYGFPSRHLTVIGITGTNGKSTTAYLATRLLEDAGIQVASFSSVRFKIAGKERPNVLKMTMPGRGQLQKLLREAVRAGCTHAIVEVTSEGIKQFRHAHISFSVACLTNVRPEHIEAHGSFERYRATKMRLFTRAPVHILNKDDESRELFEKIFAQERIVYGLTDAKNLLVSEGGSSFVLDGVALQTRLPGLFNVSNTLAAIAIARWCGVSLADIARRLPSYSTETGRMEVVAEHPVKVVVDYAHTPDALENVYETLARDHTLVCVMGSAGGGRDRWKRPLMGKIAGKMCRHVVVTNEDPYEEDPHVIIQEVAAGIEGNNYELVSDRAEAIARALKVAHPGETVIITGKGCEPWMCVANGKKIPWDDRAIVRELLS